VLSLQYSAAQSQSCSPTNTDAEAPIQYVIDGDTLMLNDGRRLRLIGINAPEVSHEDRPAESFGVQAAAALRQRLNSGSRITVVFDAERTDRHGRQLAHAFTTPDGENLQAWLLVQGLVRQLAVPPNLKYVDCYRRSEAMARQRRSGLWALPESEPRAALRLSGRTGSFAEVAGAVTAVRRTRHGVRVELGPQFALFIDRRDLGYFRGMDLKQWPGQRLRARGYLSRPGGRLSMQLRHPANVETVSISAWRKE
jgi:endonuclease YncB( thermonuclease family)